MPLQLLKSTSGRHSDITLALRSMVLVGDGSEGPSSGRQCFKWQWFIFTQFLVSEKGLTQKETDLYLKCKLFLRNVTAINHVSVHNPLMKNTALHEQHMNPIKPVIR